MRARGGVEAEHRADRADLGDASVARRMSDAAAHLVDDVLPEVPARQWVCSLPWRLRILLGYDGRLCAEVMSAFTGAVSRSLRRRAKAQLGLPSVDDAHVGAVTFLQRSDSALRLNVHAHSLFLDGVYVRAPSGVHLMRYFGVLAGHSSLRAEVVPKKPAAPPKQLSLFDETDEPTTSAKSATKKTAEPSRHPWSWLL